PCTTGGPPRRVASSLGSCGPRLSKRGGAPCTTGGPPRRVSSSLGSCGPRLSKRGGAPCTTGGPPIRVASSLGSCAIAIFAIAAALAKLHIIIILYRLRHISRVLHLR